MIKPLAKLASNLSMIWGRLNGDSAYQRYLSHWQLHHANSQVAPLSRKAYFAAATIRKWNGINRCC